MRRQNLVPALAPAPAPEPVAADWVLDSWLRPRLFVPQAAAIWILYWPAQLSPHSPAEVRAQRLAQKERLETELSHPENPRQCPRWLRLVWLRRDYPKRNWLWPCGADSPVLWLVSNSAAPAMQIARRNLQAGLQSLARLPLDLRRGGHGQRSQPLPPSQTRRREPRQIAGAGTTSPPEPLLCRCRLAQARAAAPRQRPGPDTRSAGIGCKRPDAQLRWRAPV